LKHTLHKCTNANTNAWTESPVYGHGIDHPKC